MRPLNHGFTVCRSDETTSVGWGAISARMWSETRVSATVFSGWEPTMSQVELLVTRAVSAIDAASARHDGRARARPTPPTDASMRARRWGGAASRGRRS